VNANAYKALGFLVWRAGKWYLRRSYGRYVPSRRVVGGVAVLGVVAVAAAAALNGRRDER
jgi:hypothetical protein